MSNPIDPQYLAKLKRAGFSDSEIAKRLGSDEERVKATWGEIEKMGAVLSASGFQELKELHTVGCLQFQELGKTLGKVGFALGNQISPDELGKILQESAGQDDPTAYVMSKCIVLRPFIPDDIDQQMLEYVSQYHAQEAVRQAEASGSAKN